MLITCYLLAANCIFFTLSLRHDFLDALLIDVPGRERPELTDRWLTAGMNVTAPLLSQGKCKPVENSERIKNSHSVYKAVCGKTRQGREKNRLLKSVN